MSLVEQVVVVSVDDGYYEQEEQVQTEEVVDLPVLPEVLVDHVLGPQHRSLLDDLNCRLPAFLSHRYFLKTLHVLFVEVPLLEQYLLENAVHVLAVELGLHVRLVIIVVQRVPHAAQQDFAGLIFLAN